MNSDSRDNKNRRNNNYNKKRNQNSTRTNNGKNKNSSANAGTGSQSKNNNKNTGKNRSSYNRYDGYRPASQTGSSSTNTEDKKHTSAYQKTSKAFSGFSNDKSQGNKQNQSYKSRQNRQSSNDSRQQYNKRKSKNYNNRSSNTYRKANKSNSDINNDFKSWQVDDREYKQKEKTEDDVFEKKTRNNYKRENKKESKKDVSKERSRNFAKKSRELSGSLKEGVGRVSKRVFSRDTPDDEFLNEEELKEEYNDGFYTDEVAIKNRRKRLLKRKDNNGKTYKKIKEPLSRKQRKVRNIIVSSSILAVVLIVGIVLSLTVLFKCENIEVNGLTKYTKEQLIELSGLSIGENLFLSDKKSAVSRIEACFPYIEDVNISIKIPSTMAIDVTEANPAYYLKSGDKYIIVSNKGRILDHTQDVLSNIPVITGCKLSNDNIGQYADAEDQKVMPVLNEIASSISKNNITGIKEINISNMANIKLNYEDRITIIIGLPEDLDYKLKTAMIIINQKLSVNDRGELDVSNCNGEKSKESRFREDYTVKEKPTSDATDPTDANASSPEAVIQDDGNIGMANDNQDNYIDDSVSDADTSSEEDDYNIDGDNTDINWQ